jgi:hypothetical protein
MNAFDIRLDQPACIVVFNSSAAAAAVLVVSRQGFAQLLPLVDDGRGLHHLHLQPVRYGCAGDLVERVFAGGCSAERLFLLA